MSDGVGSGGQVRTARSILAAVSADVLRIYLLVSSFAECGAARIDILGYPIPT